MSHAKRIRQLKILLVKASSHKFCLKSSFLTSPKMLHLLFYINIMEVRIIKLSHGLEYDLIIPFHFQTSSSSHYIYEVSQPNA